MNVKKISGIFSPQKVSNKIKWFLTKIRIGSVGRNVSIGLNFEIKGHENISLGDDVKIRNCFKIHAWNEYQGKTLPYTTKIEIGDGTSFGDYCYVTCVNEIRLGKNVLIGDNVFITDNNHGKSSIEEVGIPPADRDLWSKGPVIIEDNVWIGRNVSIMPNVKIGRGSVIGANSVVTKDVPEFSVVGGSPAKLIRKIN